MSKKTASVIQTIDDLLKTLEPRMKAAEADTNTDTTHPSADVEDNTRPVTTGARSAENTADIKATAVPVDSASEGPPGDQESVQVNIGMTSKETGNDPANETASVKSTKDDEPSSHPARTDNDSLNGGKYSEFRGLLKQAQEIGNDLCAAIAMASGSSARQAQPSPKTAAASPTDQVADAGPTAEQLDGLVHAELTEIVKNASVAADDLIDYLHGFAAGLTKRAEDEEEESESESDEGGEEKSEGSEGSEGGGESEGGGVPEGPPPEMTGGGAPPMGPEMGGGAPPMGGGGGDIPPEVLIALLQGQMGGGGGGAPPMGPEMGGAPPMGGGEGGLDPAMLQQVMQEMGVSPEAVQAAATAKAAELIAKNASANRHKVAAAEARRRKTKEAARGMIEELVGRNRR